MASGGETDTPGKIPRTDADYAKARSAARHGRK
jgi:non-ribosomal peptide synthetase component E (peptide arylation enzyme)